VHSVMLNLLGAPYRSICALSVMSELLWAPIADD